MEQGGVFFRRHSGSMTWSYTFVQCELVSISCVRCHRLSSLCSEAVSLYWRLRCPFWLTAVSSSVVSLSFCSFLFRLLFLLNWWTVDPSLSAPLVTPCPRRLNLLEARCAFPMQQRQKIKTLMLYRSSLWVFSVMFVCVLTCLCCVFVYFQCFCMDS